MENINLCKILKGHEGEAFYSPTFGYLYLKDIHNNAIDFETKSEDGIIQVDSKGVFLEGGELCIFPSKDQRNWNKWLEEQSPKVPKTWKELVETNKSKSYGAVVNTMGSSIAKTSIEKAALALFKIHQLIEVGYGGNKIKTCNNNVICIIYDFDVHKFIPCTCIDLWRSHIAFHTKEQAEEFLKYPENVQLLKDYFMI